MANSIRSALSIATCTLLTSVSTDETFAAGDASWQFDSSAMLYVEEERVIVNEDVILIKKEIDDDEFVSGKFIFDVMSGPSPNGASISSQPQTITSPSGQRIEIKAGSLPTYEFLDTRYAMLLDWERPLSRVLRTTHSASLSSEYDYLSGGLSSVFAYDVNDKLSTISSGFALTYDSISPVGGIPDELGSVVFDLRGSRSNQESKRLVDWMVGFSHIVNRHTIFQMNYSIGLASGYLTDPYKIISIVDDVTLEPNRINSYYNENRPDRRLSHVFYFKYIQNIYDQILRVSYRYFSDDWKIKAHTVDLKYSFPIKDNSEIQFHTRYYDQSAANFYKYYIFDSVISQSTTLSNDVKYVSADYRLGNLKTVTLGVKYSEKINFLSGVIDLRIDHLRQNDKKKQFSQLRAWLVQLVVRFQY